MKNMWIEPIIEELDISETANNIRKYDTSDGLYADTKTGAPDGYKCPFCS